MGMQINTNLAANNTYRNLNATQNDLSKSLEKLSSGLRINRAADDAAGLAISEGLRSQVGGLTVAARNAQDGISVVQTAEGGLTEVHSILQRVRDLAVQAGNDSNNEDARTAIQTEVTALSKELTRISGSTNFNGIKLLDGEAATGAAAGTGKLTFQVGAGSDAGNDQIEIDLSKSNVGTIATDVAALKFTTSAEALTSIAAIDTAIKAVSTTRSELGAVQNRFEHSIASTNVAKENLTAAQSRIRDVDMAEEMVKYTRSNVLSQAGTAMLAQANQSTQGVLSLLR
ncbi:MULTISPECIES: flagellin [Frigoribacterium]|uniref:flagellin N-terminal helical domain-containing protein n=1 Tax=Frigoribacterium TaxID=96492 RepID=UPI0006FB7B03|nr:MULTISPECIES: flagellin [Frigoribacterium]KQM29432.1 flagellin [Frigoribacterium sp. Leaf8]KQO47994.1 flagellin [Frigoribacterium sp. Leaf254]KQT40088.1 flagellin [Frigoribacterium sp. Leaf415]VXB87537.1 flagellin protein [Frigoribacterium sp. 9N]